jgi:hypothetical protein
LGRKRRYPSGNSCSENLTRVYSISTHTYDRMYEKCEKRIRRRTPHPIVITVHRCYLRARCRHAYFLCVFRIPNVFVRAIPVQTLAPAVHLGSYMVSIDETNGSSHPQASLTSSIVNHRRLPDKFLLLQLRQNPFCQRLPLQIPMEHVPTLERCDDRSRWTGPEIGNAKQRPAKLIHRLRGDVLAEGNNLIVRPIQRQPEQGDDEVPPGTPKVVW